jgi:hypothetical protein
MTGDDLRRLAMALPEVDKRLVAAYDAAPQAYL